jgi:hypothetical protein
MNVKGRLCFMEENQKEEREVWMERTIEYQIENFTCKYEYRTMKHIKITFKRG